MFLTDLFLTFLFFSLEGEWIARAVFQPTPLSLPPALSVPLCSCAASPVISPWSFNLLDAMWCIVREDPCFLNWSCYAAHSYTETGISKHPGRMRWRGSSIISVFQHKCCHLYSHHQLDQGGGGRCGVLHSSALFAWGNGFTTCYLTSTLNAELYWREDFPMVCTDCPDLDVDLQSTRLWRAL